MGGHAFRVKRVFKPGRLGRDGITRGREIGAFPRGITAIQDMDILMAEQLEKPERPCAGRKGAVVVEKDGVVERDIPLAEQVGPHPDEGSERSVVGIVAGEVLGC